MTRLVIKSDASVLDDGTAGIGYHVSRVNGQDEDEMLVKEREQVTVDGSNHSSVVHEAEFIALVRGVEAAMEHVQDGESLDIRCDNGYIVRRIEDGERRRGLGDMLSQVEWEITDIPRIFNSLADSLSKQASTGKAR